MKKQKTCTLLQTTTIMISFLLILTIPEKSIAGVKGHFSSSSGTKSEIVLNIGNPAPNSIIVEQRSSAKAVQTNPGAQKIRGGDITWLLRNPNPGQLHLTSQFKNPLKSKPAATVKYKDRKSGQFIVQPIN